MNHILMIHPETNVHECSLCDKKYLYHKGLMTHKKKVHGKESVLQHRMKKGVQFLVAKF